MREITTSEILCVTGAYTKGTYTLEIDFASFPANVITGAAALGAAVGLAAHYIITIEGARFGGDPVVTLLAGAGLAGGYAVMGVMAYYAGGYVWERYCKA